MNERQAGSYRVSKYTPAQMALKRYLDKQGIKTALEYEVPRYNEWNGNRLKTYSIDIFVLDSRYYSVAIEVEGDHSNTTNNLVREKFLQRLGIATLHVPNEIAIEFPEDVLKQLNEKFLRKEVDFP